MHDIFTWLNFYPKLKAWSKLNWSKPNGIAMVTIAGPVLTIMSFIGMRETATKEVFDWLLQNPKIVRATYIIIRFMDDMASHKVQ